MELIKLPLNLGLEIVGILRKKGIEPRKETEGILKGSLSLKFSQEELNLITDLTIENPTFNCLDGIEHLHNLKKLNISTVGSTAYQKEAASITDKDIEKIAKLTSLTSLTINNQSKISWVYLDNLVNLEEIEITRNSFLEEISGLKKLHKLKDFTEYGNKNLFMIDDINEMIQQNDLEIFETDVLHFPELNPSQKKLTNMVNCDFTETFAGKKSINYSYYQLLLFHNKCCEIVEEAQKFSNDKRDQIIFIEKYLAENIKYDYSGLNSEKRAYYDGEKQKGKSGGTNSAYNGIMFGAAVCEGYTRSMQYILKLLGIKTKNVMCISGANKISINHTYHNQITLPNDGYHSIIRIEEQNSIYYCDPCWDSCSWHRGRTSLPYCLLTKEEISKDHTLSFEEDEVIYNIEYPRLYIKNTLDRLQIHSLENANNNHAVK